MMIWSHNREVINFDSPRGGISLVTEKGPETTSRLMIQKAVPSDSGHYTCEPSNANPSTIKASSILDKSHVIAPKIEMAATEQRERISCTGCNINM
ncbi:hypothetical protein EAI_07826 [Harpegnathos saltator]|uniref:Ig-like domain-containing protein n=1 Tax=Harpegnathos saltator TaxID=610380 RepID=E2BLH8_HARSA|nr:hypothetical protein EAI_07826 [Harpegnathos saltator]